MRSDFDETAAWTSAVPASSPAARGDRLVHDTMSVPPGDMPADRASALQFGTDVRPLLVDALSAGDTAADLLAAASDQARALAAVWEAHSRGAITLPDAVADAVRRARECWPVTLRPIAAPRSASRSARRDA